MIHDIMPSTVKGYTKEDTKIKENCGGEVLWLGGSNITLQMVTVAMKLKDPCS